MNRLNAFLAEVDRDRTSMQRFQDFIMSLARTTSDATDELEPTWKWARLIAAIFGARYDSENAKLLAKTLGGTPEQQAAALKNLTLLTPEVQASEAWLGGGENSGAAKILKDTAAFLKDQGKVSEVLPSYAAFVTPDALVNASN